MPPTIGGVTIDPQGQTLTVSIVPAAKVYTDKAGTTLAVFPATVTTRTSYWMSAAQPFTVSVKTASGNEIADKAGQPLVIDIQQGVMQGIAPVIDRPGPEDVGQSSAGGFVPLLVALDAADTTGVNNAVALQAAINSAADGTRIVPPNGSYPLKGVSIDGKTRLSIDNPACRFVRQSGSSLGGMFTLGGTTANTDITLNVECDGNNFVSGQAVLCKQTTGFKLGSGFYAHHWRSHGVGFHTTASSKIDIADGARFEFIGIGVAADPTFDPSFPNGVAIYFAVPCPDVRIGQVFCTDVKGIAAIYINGCAGMKIVSPTIKRTGYRGIMTTSASVTGLEIIEPTCEDIGILYEIKSAANGGHDPGDSLYGQGTNGIYLDPAGIALASDARVVGGKFVRCGENGIEGRGVWDRPLVIDPGYAYTGFGSGRDRSGLIVNSKTYVFQPKIFRPPVYGIGAFATAALTDVHIDRPYIEDPASKGVHLQESGSFTMSNVSVVGAHVVVKTATPSHAVHVRGTSGGTLASTVLIMGTRGVGTFSTQVVETGVTGGGTNSAQTWDNTLATNYASAADLTSVQSALAVETTNRLAFESSAALPPFPETDVTGLTADLASITARLTVLEARWTDLIRTSTSTAKNTNTTYADDDTLTLTIATGTYELFGLIAYRASTASDLKMRWTVPSGTTGSWTVIGQTAGAVSGGIAQINPLPISLTTDQIVGGGGASLSVGCIITAHIIITTSGTFALQWAQNTSDATDTTLMANSRLMLRKVA